MADFWPIQNVQTILKQRVVKQTETNKEFRAVIASKSKKIVKT